MFTFQEMVQLTLRSFWQWWPKRWKKQIQKKKWKKPLGNGISLHRYLMATLPFLQKLLLNKATYDCSFANSSSMFTIFGILVNNAIADRSDDFSCHGNHICRNVCVTIVTKMVILLSWLGQEEYKVYEECWYGVY